MPIHTQIHAFTYEITVMVLSMCVYAAVSAYNTALVDCTAWKDYMAVFQTEKKFALSSFWINLHNNKGVYCINVHSL